DLSDPMVQMMNVGHYGLILSQSFLHSQIHMETSKHKHTHTHAHTHTHTHTHTHVHTHTHTHTIYFIRTVIRRFIELYRTLCCIYSMYNVCVCVCVCVSEREREREVCVWS